MINSTNLWTRVIKQKYLPHESIEDWIRRPWKSHSRGSVIWKAVVKSFSLIESSLTWDVGSGENVQIGRDPWMGSEQYHILPAAVINALALRGISTLNQLDDQRPEEPWTQHWKSADMLGLGEHEIVYYENYIRGLQLAHIQISEQDDVLIWDSDPAGV